MQIDLPDEDVQCILHALKTLGLPQGSVDYAALAMIRHTCKRLQIDSDLPRHLKTEIVEVQKEREQPENASDLEFWDSEEK